MIPKEADVLVVGGGPAGSTAAAILAKEGIDTVLLERDEFPRYHIGESLLPSIIPILEISGAREAVEKHGFVKKPGAYLEWGSEKWSLVFGELSGIAATAYQVVRSEFDKILLDNASDQGAQVFQPVGVDTLEFVDARPVAAHYTDRVTKQEGEIRFKHLIDCTGRAGLIAHQHLDVRRYHNVFKNIALWSYWTGAHIEGFGQPGSIRVFSIDAGWLWFIPLHDGTISVGVVVHQQQLRTERGSGSYEEAYDRILKRHPQAAKILAAASRTAVKVEQDYSYTSETFSGPGYFIAGDAACFLDPLLSSGIHLATFSGLIAAAAVSSVRAGEVSEGQAATYFEKSYRQAYLRFLVFVSAFYDQNRGQKGYFWEAQRLTSKDYNESDLKRAFISLVSGGEDYTDMQSPDQDSAIVSRIGKRLRENLDLRNDKEAINPTDKKVQENLKFFDAVEGLFVLSKSNAIDGLYVTTQPNVRLMALQ